MPYTELQMLRSETQSSCPSAETMVTEALIHYVFVSMIDLASSGRESFNVGRTGDHLVLPTNCLEAWLDKFDAKFRRDPDFLMHAGEKS